MRKIIVSMNITVDGFIAGPDCELDWHFSRWSTEMAEALGEKLSQADTILFGRVTYNAMAGYWQSRYHHTDLPREEYAFAEMMQQHRKIVFSRSMQNAPWENSMVVKGNMQKAIAALKQQPGKDMIVYGSGRLVSALMKKDLIDGYTLWIHPVLLGKGRRFSKGLNKVRNMELKESVIFQSGVVRMEYRSVG